MSDDYHRIAPWYDLLLDPFARAMRPVGFNLFEPDPGAEVLEIGCGTGAQLAFYRARGVRVTGIVRSPAMLRVARARTDAHILLCRGDAACLPFPDGVFALVLATLVPLEMDPGQRPAVMGDMVRVLAPQGRIGIVDYHPQPRRSLKGILARRLIRGIERAAGILPTTGTSSVPEAFRNWPPGRVCRSSAASGSAAATSASIACAGPSETIWPLMGAAQGDRECPAYRKAGSAWLTTPAGSKDCSRPCGPWR